MAKRWCVSAGVGSVLIALAILPAAAANLIECGVGGNNLITASCGEDGIPLRVKINNSAPQNPNVDHTLHLGLGVGSGDAEVRSPDITVSPSECVGTIPSRLDPVSVEVCGPNDEHIYHTSGPRTVSYNTGQAVTLANVRIDGLCPGACNVVVPIDYFFEGPDPDAVATWDTAACDATGAAPTVVASEDLQPRATCTFEITCIEAPPSEAQGRGPAAGTTAKAYVMDEAEPGTSRISFDARNHGQAAGEVMEYSLGAPGDDFPLGSESADVLAYNQLHFLVPTPLVDAFEDADGVLQYYVRVQGGPILYSTAPVQVPLAPPIALLLGAGTLTASAGLWMRRARRVGNS